MVSAEQDGQATGWQHPEFPAARAHRTKAQVRREPQTPCTRWLFCLPETTPSSSCRPSQTHRTRSTEGRQRVSEAPANPRRDAIGRVWISAVVEAGLLRADVDIPRADRCMRQTEDLRTVRGTSRMTRAETRQIRRWHPVTLSGSHGVVLTRFPGIRHRTLVYRLRRRLHGRPDPRTSVRRSEGRALRAHLRGHPGGAGERLARRDAFGHLRAGNTLIVWLLDRLGRSLKGMMRYSGCGRAFRPLRQGTLVRLTG